MFATSNVPGIRTQDLHLYLCTLGQKSPLASPASRMRTKKAFKMIYCKWFSTLLAKIITQRPDCCSKFDILLLLFLFGGPIHSSKFNFQNFG